MLFWIVSVGVAAGFLYLITPTLIPYLEKRPGALYWVVATGFGLRLLLMVPEPFYEIDYFRYLWDGAVTLSGHSPYQWSPEQVLSGDAPAALTQLALNSGGIIEQINYPHLTTIYPPVAEAMFALTSWIAPWSLMAWRGIILIFEIITVALLFALLRHFNRSRLWIIVYWWNPVVIVEFSNAAHMDAILLPFLIAACFWS